MAQRRRSLLVAVLFFQSAWPTVAFPLLSGAVLAQRGFRLSDSLLYVGTASLGAMGGVLIAALLVDRVERRTALLGSAGGMLLSGTLFIMAREPDALILSSLCFTLFAAIYVPTLTLYCAELFPTAERAASTGRAWAFNRVAAACAPFVLVPLLRNAGPRWMFLAIAVMLVSSALVLGLSPHGHRSRSVT